MRRTCKSKAKFLNPGRSIKDRIALAMIEEAKRKGHLSVESIIVELSSGNAGTDIALFGRLKRYKVKIVMLENMNEECKKN